MTRAVRNLSSLGALLVLGWVGVAVTNPSAGSERPLRGSIAPLDTSRVDGWQELARLKPEDLASGRIRALDLVQDSLLVLQANAWSLVVGGEFKGTYGTAITGAPEYIGRAEGIVFAPHGITVLDAPRHRLIYWSPTGSRLSEHSLRDPTRTVVLHSELTPSARGAFVTSWVGSDSGGQWLLSHVDDAGLDTVLYSRSLEIGESFNVPHIAAFADSSVTVVDASTWRLRYLDAGHALVDSASRRNAPFFAPPVPLARRIRERVAQMPETQRLDFAMTDALPSVRALTATEDGQLLVLTVRDDESTIAELVQANGTAVASLWAVPDSNDIFAVRGQLLRVRELDDVIVIERLRLRRHD